MLQSFPILLLIGDKVARFCMQIKFTCLNAEPYSIRRYFVVRPFVNVRRILKM